VLLGVTGSGKTFTMAKVIEQVQRPTLILAPNKTLAAQLYGEMKSFFPDNAVEYFVSYYDYYQPEAYVPRTDTYIEKDAQINEQIDRMRHSATQALLERNDVIIVASVSCIYGIGSVETYSRMVVKLERGGRIDRDALVKGLVEQQYRRNDAFFAARHLPHPRRDVDIWPSHLEDRAWRVSLFGDEVDGLREFDPLTGEIVTASWTASPSTPTATTSRRARRCSRRSRDIKEELKERLAQLHAEGKLLEAQRLEQRTTFDIEMLETTGSCKGIENYSRYLTGRKPGEPPPTLFEYLPENALLIVDESHVTVPQIGGMYRGDFARKSILNEFGFRLPSCTDNRPLKFEEWDAYRPQTVFVSATPGPVGDGAHRRRLRRAGDPPDRPGGPRHGDPPRRGPGGRPARRMPRGRAEGRARAGHDADQAHGRGPDGIHDEAGIRVRYLHSATSTRWSASRSSATCARASSTCWSASTCCARASTSRMRAGRDPGCRQGRLPALSTTSLIQTIGRAARNVEGRVVLYADVMTDSLRARWRRPSRRRAKQIAWNEEHGITPQSIKRDISDVLQSVYEQDYVTVEAVEGDETANFVGKDLRATIAELEKKMRAAAGRPGIRGPRRGCATRSSGWKRWSSGCEPNQAGRSLQGHFRSDRKSRAPDFTSRMTKPPSGSSARTSARRPSGRGTCSSGAQRRSRQKRMAARVIARVSMEERGEKRTSPPVPPSTFFVTLAISPQQTKKVGGLGGKFPSPRPSSALKRRTPGGAHSGARHEPNARAADFMSSARSASASPPHSPPTFPHPPAASPQ
jgi:excinuclease ABC subunit B